MTIAAFLFYDWNLATADDFHENGWPLEVIKAESISTKDQSRQSMLICSAKSQKKRPLLVGLHTWSGNYLQAGGETVYARWCLQNDWHFVHPNFRGPNHTPKALGSEFMVQDILDAIDYMKHKHAVDTDRIYLIGVSGGGHAALLMAGRRPEIWAGVSAWCPISDIETWWNFHAFNQGKYNPGRYAKHIEQAIGGRPDSKAKLSQECQRRSPLTYLKNSRRVNLDLNHGIQDGRKGSVPFTHSIEAFNQVALPSQRITETQINQYYSSLKLPPSLQAADPDPLYGSHKPLFRRVSGNTRITIFAGGHEILHVAALNWLAKQRRGQKATWEIKKTVQLQSTAEESQADK
jgi:pimeloyl-ACP methyl ester carboxylesterase